MTLLETAKERPEPGTVIDSHLVAGQWDGERMEWRLVVQEDGTEHWKPFYVDEDDRIIKTPIWMPLPGSQFLFLQCPIFEALFEGTRGPGKRLNDNADILTDSGWKRVKEVTFSDRLVAPDGTYTDILGIYPKESGTMYKVTFDDGASVECDGDHLWTVRDAKNFSRDGWTVKDTDQLIGFLKNGESKKGSARNSWYIPTISEPAPGETWRGLDPYVLGLLLGDGTLAGHYTTLYTNDEWTRDYMEMVHGWRAYRYEYSTCWMVQETNSNRSTEWKMELNLAPGSKAEGKVVPDELLYADPEARLACLQGLMDADGTVDEQGRCRFVSLSERLAKNVQYLVRSLGGKAKCYWEYRESLKGGVDGRWRVNVQHGNKFNPFRLPRKADRIKDMNGTDRRIVSIEKVEDAPATCFEVAHPSHLFVCQDFIVTHNTLSLLMDFAKDVGKGYGSSWRGILFRREYKDLDDIVKKIEEWFPLMWPGFRFLHSKAEYMAIWPTGEQLLLRAGESEEVYKTFHGHEYPWIGFEELTQWEDDGLFLKMQSCCRASKPGVPTRVRATTNPFGPGHCLPFGEVLTSDRGWVDIKDMKPGDSIVSVRQDGSAYNTKITDVVREQYDGTMVSRKGRGLHMEFTENHRLPHLNTAGTSHEVKPYYDLPGQANIRRAATEWGGQSLDIVNIPRADTRTLRFEQPLELSGEDYAEFMGWYLSEGCTVPRDKAFQIAQCKSHNRTYIENLLSRIGFRFHKDDQGFTVYSPSWYEYLSPFGKCRDKFVPDNIKQADRNILGVFFNAVMAGDGHWQHEGKSGIYYTTSKQLADDMAEISVKLGYRVYVSSRQRANREGLSYAVNFAPGTSVQLNTGNHVYDVQSKSNNVNVEKKHFSGEVYCVTVPDTETFFVRQNGCVWLSGNTWVKKRYGLPQMRGRVIKLPGQMPRVAIHGSLSENFLLLHTSPNYVMTLRNSTKNPNEAKAWIEGDWNVTAGGMVDDLWRPNVHILPNFPINMVPSGWNLTRAYDHGQSHPFAVGWWLESNGEALELPNGKVIGNKRGDLILWKEWYGSNGESNVGLRMPSKKIAQGIFDREEDWGVRQGREWCKVMPGPADSEIFNKLSDRDGKCPADDMEEVGIYWERADKTSGSRKRGWEMLRTMLAGAVPNHDGTREDPGLFVCENCVHWIELIPPMPRDTKDQDEVPDKYEDHHADMTRYRLNWEAPIMWRRGF